MTFDFSLTRPKPRPSIRVAFDLETFLIGPTIQSPPVVAMGFRIDGGRVHVVAANDSAFDRVVESLFGDPSVRIFAHNARFDVLALLAHGAKFGKRQEWAAMLLGAAHDDRVTCTLIRESLLRIAVANPMKMGLKYDLGTCCDEWATKTRPNKLDPWRLKWGSLADRHASEYPLEALTYLCEDIFAVDELYVAQERKAAWLVDQYRQTRASIALGAMSSWGFRTDPVAAQKLYDSTAAELAEAAEICVAHGLMRPDGTRNKKAAETRMLAAFESRGLAAPRGAVTEKMAEKDEDSLGNVKLDDEACTLSQDPVLIAYSKASQAATLLSKAARFLKPVLQPLFQTLVSTGRTSCSQGSDPKPGFAPAAHAAQLQNLPRAEGARECLVARPGAVLIDCDYAAMELRTLAQYERWEFGSSKLGDILNDPKRCPHVELGAAIIEVSVELAYAMRSSDPAAFKEMRQLAKGFNFGGPGGSGAEAMVKYCLAGYGVRISVEQARKVLKLLKEYYPERPRYLALANDAVRASKSGRARETLRYSGFVRGGMSYTERANFPFQALAATCAKEAMWRICVESYAVPESPLYGTRPVNFVHDQIIAETPETGYEAATARLEQLWVGGAQDILTDVLVLAPAAVCRRWSKSSGDPVYWPDGRLAIYEEWLAAKEMEKAKK